MTFVPNSTPTLVKQPRKGVVQIANADASNNLNVNCAVGCAGGSFNNNADAVATSATNGQAAAWP